VDHGTKDATASSVRPGATEVAVQRVNTRQWVLACSAAEAVGMGASAAAARGALSVGTTAGFLLVLVGGLVEGTALGLLQARVLGARLGAARRLWVLVTVAVAGLGWAAGSAPAALSGETGDAAPPLGWMISGGAALGATMGAVLGLGQAAVLRHCGSRRPWRWVWANAAGWAVAMPVIFTGASTAGVSWPWPALVCWGAATGALAGAALGLVTGVWLPSLDGPSVRHRLAQVWLTRRRSGVRSG
jgi:hypothetical protein